MKRKIKAIKEPKEKMAKWHCKCCGNLWVVEKGQEEKFCPICDSERILIFNWLDI